MARLKIGVIPIEGGHYYREALEEVTRAEELGFESVWMEEHHAVTDHYWPSPLTVLAGFATRTSRVLLGTDILVAAFYHPVRLAEDVALLADNWIPGPTADLKRLLEGKRQFLDNRRAAGRTASITEWPLTRDVIIADTDRAARELAERHIMVAYRKEYAGGWRHPFIDASIATDLDRLMADRFIIGGPEHCVAAIKRFVEAYGMTHLICRTFFPGMPHTHIMRELELIAREVMPAFR